MINRVNLHQCELLPDVDLKVNRTQLFQIRRAIKVYINEASVTEDCEDWISLQVIVSKCNVLLNNNGL